MSVNGRMVIWMTCVWLNCHSAVYTQTQTQTETERYRVHCHFPSPLLDSPDVVWPGRSPCCTTCRSAALRCRTLWTLSAGGTEWGSGKNTRPGPPSPHSNLRKEMKNCAGAYCRNFLDTVVLGDDEVGCWLVRFTLSKMLTFCLNYLIG